MQCDVYLRSGVLVAFSDSWRGTKDIGVRGMVLALCQGGREGAINVRYMLCRIAPT